MARTLATVAMLTLSLAAMFPAHAQRIRAASGGLSIILSLLWVTYEQKLVKKYDPDLEYLAIENGTVGMQALLANVGQFLFSNS